MELYAEEPTSDLRCIYCDNLAETWDHLFGLVINGKYSGYGHRIRNLVPCCKACNSSKGNKNWEIWLRPRGNHVTDIEERVKRIRRYAQALVPDPETAVPGDLRNQYTGIKQSIVELMRQADEVSSKIRMSRQTDNSNVFPESFQEATAIISSDSGDSCHNNIYHVENNVTEDHIVGGLRFEYSEGMLAVAAEVDYPTALRVIDAVRHAMLSSSGVPLDRPSGSGASTSGAERMGGGQRRAFPSPGEPMTPEEHSFVVDRIQRWAANSNLIAHRIVGLVVRAKGGIDRKLLIDEARRATNSESPSGAIASLMTSKGNAYGRVLFVDGGLIRIYPDVTDEVAKYNWR